MLLNNEATPIIRYGEMGQDQEFKIKSTPKAFSILISKLYRDKIAAVIREISCNAHDSHVAAGQVRPFFVHLPNVLRPELAIRDYGTGLSDDDVRDIFTTFFASTKEDTNDYIGALGLGSKSPLAYSDSYTVKSFLNGMLTTFICFIENSLPKVRLISKVETCEENGLEVIVPVRSEDFSSFSQKAGKIYRWFDLHPTVEGGQYYHVEGANPVKTGRGWQYYTNNGVSKAIMGQVCYPIDSAVMFAHLSEWEKKLLHNFVFHFSIGQLDIQAGREELSYDAATIACIKASIIAALETLSADSTQLLEDCESFVAASARFLTKQSDFILSLAAPRWRDKIVTGKVVPPIDGKSLLVRPRQNMLAAFSKRERNMAVIEVTTIEPWPNSIIFINDLKSGGMSRFKNFSRDNYKNICYLFVPDEETPEQARLAFSEYTDVRFTSSISVEKKTTKLRKLNRNFINHFTYLEKKYRAEIDVDLEDGGVYVLTKSNDIMDGSEDFSSLIHYLKVFWNITNQDIICVPWSIKKPFENNPNWLTLKQFLANKLDDIINDDFVEDIHAIHDRTTFTIKLFERSEQIVEHLPRDHSFTKLVARYHQSCSAVAERWYPVVLDLNDEKKVISMARLKLSKLWRGLDHLPLLQAVAGNSVLTKEALADLGKYASNKSLEIKNKIT